MLKQHLRINQRGELWFWTARPLPLVTSGFNERFPTPDDDLQKNAFADERMNGLRTYAPFDASDYTPSRPVSSYFIRTDFFCEYDAASVSQEDERLDFGKVISATLGISSVTMNPPAGRFANSNR